MTTFDDNLNPLVFTMMFICLLGSIFLATKKIDAGYIYGILILSALGVSYLLNFWLKDDDNLKPLTDYLKMPISGDLRTTCVGYMIGIGVPILIKLILVFMNIAVSQTSFSIPLFASDISEGFQSFSTAEISNSVSWDEFITVYVAGTAETFIFSLIMIFALVFVGLFIFRMLTDDDRIGFISEENFVIWFALIFTAVIFMLLHSLNSTYTSGLMFALAFGFMLLSNISIFFFGVPFAFWIGFHQMNNFIYKIEQLGFVEAISGLFGIFGIIFIGSMILIGFYLLRTKSSNSMFWWKTR